MKLTGGEGEQKCELHIKSRNWVFRLVPGPSTRAVKVWGNSGKMRRRDAAEWVTPYKYMRKSRRFQRAWWMLGAGWNSMGCQWTTKTREATTKCESKWASLRSKIKAEVKRKQELNRQRIWRKAERKAPLVKFPHSHTLEFCCTL